MKCQIQVRGDWNGLDGDWRPIAVRLRDGIETTTFASWDEAEDGLDRMQQAGLLPTDAERYGVELRIIDIDDRRRAKRAETTNELLAPSASGVAQGALEAHTRGSGWLMAPAESAQDAAT